MKLKIAPILISWPIQPLRKRLLRKRRTTFRNNLFLRGCIGQEISYGLTSQIEVLFIRSSRIYWELTVYSHIGIDHRPGLPWFSYGFERRIKTEASSVRVALLDAELSYHRWIAWGLYLDASLYVSPPEWLAEPKIRKEISWESYVRGSISLSYYF